MIFMLISSTDIYCYHFCTQHVSFAHTVGEMTCLNPFMHCILTIARKQWKVVGVHAKFVQNVSISVFKCKPCSYLPIWFEV